MYTQKHILYYLVVKCLFFVSNAIFPNIANGLLCTWTFFIKKAAKAVVFIIHPYFDFFFNHWIPLSFLNMMAFDDSTLKSKDSEHQFFPARVRLCVGKVN